MGETAKLLNLDKEVLVPRVAACALADSITAEQVRALREKHHHETVRQSYEFLRDESLL